MAYAVQADLNLSETRLIELTDSADAPGEIDATVLAACLVEATAIADGILAPAGAGPYTSDDVPPLVTVCTAWIWAYRLYRHREVMEIPEAIKDDYKRAFELLKEMAAGIIGDGDGGLTGTTASDSQVPDFTVSSPRGWTSRSTTED